MKILITHQLLYYREALTCALRELRLTAEVVTVEPDLLDAEVDRFGPDLVVSDHVTIRVETQVRSWVELYKGGGSWSVVCVDGRRCKIDGPNLEELLSIVDHVENAKRG